MESFKVYIKKSKVTFVFIMLMWPYFLISLIWTKIFGYHFIYGLFAISIDVLLKMGSNVPVFVYHGQVYRLFTAIFLHAGIIQLMLNTIVLIICCAPFEKKSSLLLYLIVLIGGGIQGNIDDNIGNMFSTFINNKFGNKYITLVGASVSICSIMGLFAIKVYVDAVKNNEKIKYPIKEIIIMSIYLMLVTILPGMDFFGLFGSILSGVLVGMIAFVGYGNQEMRPLFIKGIVGLSIYTIILFLL